MRKNEIFLAVQLQNLSSQIWFNLTKFRAKTCTIVGSRDIQNVTHGEGTDYTTMQLPRPLSSERVSYSNNTTDLFIIPMTKISKVHQQTPHVLKEVFD